jgi:hypothetical protein
VGGVRDKTQSVTAGDDSGCEWPGGQPGELVIGEDYYVEGTRGLDYFGRLVAIFGPQEIVLTGAYVVGDTGVAHTFFATGRAPYTRLSRVGPWRGIFASIRPWTHGLDYGDVLEVQG